MTDNLAAAGVPTRSPGAEIGVERLFEVTYLAPESHGRTILVLNHGTISNGTKGSARAIGIYDLTGKGTALNLKFALLLGGRHGGDNSKPLNPILVRITVPLEATDHTFTTDTTAGRVRLRLRRIWEYPKEAAEISEPETTPA